LGYLPQQLSTPVSIPTPVPISTPVPIPITKPADLDLVAIAPVVLPIKPIAGLSVEFRLLTDFDMPRGVCLSWNRDKKEHPSCLLRYLPSLPY